MPCYRRTGFGKKIMDSEAIKKACPLMSTRAWHHKDSDEVIEITPCIGFDCQFWLAVEIVEGEFNGVSYIEGCCHKLNVILNNKKCTIIEIV